MNDILGKWQQPQGQPFPGLWFDFRPDGTYKAVLEEMGITSSGTYTAENGIIDINQTQHTSACWVNSRVSMLSKPIN
jgi:hypothetical protein